MKILGPKFVKRANQWCVTILNEKTKDKEAKQEILWFDSIEKAKDEIKQRTITQS